MIIIKKPFGIKFDHFLLSIFVLTWGLNRFWWFGQWLSFILLLLNDSIHFCLRNRVSAEHLFHKIHGLDLIVVLGFIRYLFFKLLL